MTKKRKFKKRAKSKSIDFVTPKFFLKYFGVLGLAVTIIGALDSFLSLTHFVRFLVEHWQLITKAFWNAAFNFFGLSVSPTVAGLLNAWIFLLALEGSAYLAGSRNPERDQINPFLLRFSLKILNCVILFALFIFILTATVLKFDPDLSKGLELPKANSIFSVDWSNQNEWFPFLVFVLAGSQVQAGMFTPPLSLLVRFFQVGIIVVSILILNYISVLASFFQKWLSSMTV